MSDALTYANLAALMRRFPASRDPLRDFNPYRFAGLDIYEIPYLPTERIHVGTRIILGHPLAVWWCRLWGISPWVNAGPIYEQRPKAMGYMLGHRLFIPPGMSQALVCAVMA